jgi:hypothetical protein
MTVINRQKQDPQKGALLPALLPAMLPAMLTAMLTAIRTQTARRKTCGHWLRPGPRTLSVG